MGLLHFRTEKYRILFPRYRGHDAHQSRGCHSVARGGCKFIDTTRSTNAMDSIICYAGSSTNCRVLQDQDQEGQFQSQNHPKPPPPPTSVKKLPPRILVADTWWLGFSQPPRTPKKSTTVAANRQAKNTTQVLWIDILAETITLASPWIGEMEWMH